MSVIEYFCDNRYSIFTNVLTSLIGAFFGFGFSLLIYYRQTKKEKEKEEKVKNEIVVSNKRKKEQNNKDLLKYYSVLMNKFLLVVDKELELLDEYISKQEKDLTVLQILPKVPSYDAQRIKNIDNKGVFEAWTSIFSDEDIIQQYQKTNSAIDILDGAITETHKTHDYVSQDYYNRLLDVKSIVDDISDRLSSIAFDMHKSLGDMRKKDGFYVLINESIIKYHELVNLGASLEVFINEMVIPLLKGVYEDFISNPYSDGIMMLCKKARVKLNDVKTAVNGSVNDFKKVKDKVEESVGILKNSIDKINNVPLTSHQTQLGQVSIPST